MQVNFLKNLIIIWILIAASILFAEDVITDLKVYDQQNGDSWQVCSNLQIGDTQYGDRGYTFASIPEVYRGYDWIQTANDSKEYEGDTLATFYVTLNTEVLVAFDDRLTRREWLQDWTDTGTDLVNSEDPPQTFSLYKQYFTHDQKVVIGPIAQSSGASNLTILVSPGESELNIPDPFEIETVFDAQPSSEMYSGVITISGLSETASISMDQGQYSINGGEFKTGEGQIGNSDQVQFLLQVPSTYSTVAVSEIRVGDYETNFVVRTQDDPAAGWQLVPDILARIQTPDFSDRDFVITDYGAVDDGSTLCTEAFEQAITACHEAGGGRVVVPEGEFLTGAIHLKSNVNLHLEEDALVKFSQEPADYLPVVYTRFEGTECYNYSPFIYAFEKENIAITGQGVLDGQGDNDHWWPWKNKQSNDVSQLRSQGENEVPVEERVYGEGHYLRPNMIQFYRCDNILIDSVTILNGAMWHIHPVLSENITVTNVTVEGHGPNNDGCNPESCQDVLIDNCLFNTGDDCVAIKAGRNADGRRIGVASENIIVQNCNMKDGHGGVVIGSEMTGGARNIFARDCYMDSPNLNRALRIKTNSRRGGTVENVYFKDVTVGVVSDALVWVNFYYSSGDDGDFTPTVRNIKVENVTCQNCNYALWLKGYNRSPIENVQLVNCTIDDANRNNILYNVQNLSLNQVTINNDLFNTIIEPVDESQTAIKNCQMSKQIVRSATLHQNYPNPFNPGTNINYIVHNKCKVSLDVYNLKGQKVACLLDDVAKKAGEYSVFFDGSSLSSGIYIYRLITDSGILNRKMLYLK